MRMTSSMVSHNLTNLHIKLNPKFQTFFFHPIFHPEITKQNKHGFSFPSNQTLQYLSTGRRATSYYKSKMDFKVYSSDQTGDLIPFAPLLCSVKGWILGVLITVIVPFLAHKWGPLLKWTKVIEAAEEKVEEVAEGVEKVAEEVEKLAEEVADVLPDGGKLRNAVTIVENVAKETAKDANVVEGFINKAEVVEKEVEEVEKEVESVVEPVNGKSNAKTNGGHDQK